MTAVGSVLTWNPYFLELRRALIGLTAEKKTSKSKDTTPDDPGIGEESPEFSHGVLG